MQLLHCRIAKPPSGADFPSIFVAFWAVPSALLAYVPPPAKRRRRLSSSLPRPPC
ncbi:hypothetical protein GQ607_010288 [Colletotrichum asianum]|uniref:Uncharacterized protein n=1 Tax=Colletotrichum asianum TaxID=702518 RepID=A0A8H3W9R8_9PEZI|nr:hypothetical protein GQ607_010288 [Colletotrichum asianum]